MSKSRGSSAARIFLVFFVLAFSLSPSAAATAAPARGGRKFAILIGVNRYPYLPAEKQLEWAVADAGHVNSMLVRDFGFPADNVTHLYNTDATRARILRALHDAAARVGQGDVFVLFYSGHGTLFPDSKSDVLDETEVIGQIVDGQTQQLRRLLRPDKFDSAICPSDTGGPSTSDKGWENLILDDELFDIFSEFTSRGCEVVLLADSCNSGSLAKGIEGGGGDRTKEIPPRMALGRDWDDIPAPRFQRRKTRAASDLDGRFIALTAAKDNELAWESESGGGGFFTQALVAAAAGGNNVATFECLFRALKRNVKEKRSIQEPQMDTRFFSGAPTGTLFLNYAEPSRLKVLVKVTDTQGRDIQGATFAVLRQGVPPKANIEERDTLLLGRTDFGGLYDSGCPQFESGTFWVVAFKQGYRAFEQRMTIEANAPGVAVLRIKLSQL